VAVNFQQPLGQYPIAPEGPGMVQGPGEQQGGFNAMPRPQGWGRGGIFQPPPPEGGGEMNPALKNYMNSF
jgi:hypothetical protein